MKDSYSFDRDEAGLDVSFQAHRGAYERIWERCGIETACVEAESGMMGGSESFDYLAPSGSGENTLVTCENGDYAADLEIARGVPRAPEFPERARRARRDRDAGHAHVRGAGRAALDRPGRDLEGDAGDAGRRHARARAPARRRPARGGEAAERARLGLPARDRRRRSSPASAPRAARSGRSASRGR